jgi:hypothetical protein
MLSRTLSPSHLILPSILLLGCVDGPVLGAIPGRLQVAPNGRHLQYADGSPSWFDPRYGATYEFRVSPRAWDGHTYQTFTPPTSGRGQDWVLVFEAVTKDGDTVTPIGN